MDVAATGLHQRSFRGESMEAGLLDTVAPPLAPEQLAELPEFPRSKPLEIDDRPAIEACTHRLPCSSDHNFTSVWMWDVCDATRVSRLGENLVIQLPDYQTHQPLTTLVGDDDVAWAAEMVLASGVERLQLVPEFVTAQLPSTRFVVEPERDQHDYVYSVERLAEFAGSTFAKLRQQANRCVREIGERLAVAPIADVRLLLEIFDRWTGTRGKDDQDVRDERAAVQRLVSAWDDLDVHAIGLYDGDELIGAEIHEFLPGSAIGHFLKADARYCGIFPLLQRVTAQHLAASEVRELNLEQDLGLPGLRASKLRYRPVRFVSKFQVRMRCDSR
jgi:hypothetical protein